MVILINTRKDILQNMHEHKYDMVCESKIRQPDNHCYLNGLPIIITAIIHAKILKSVSTCCTDGLF